MLSLVVWAVRGVVAGGPSEAAADKQWRSPNIDLEALPCSRWALPRDGLDVLGAASGCRLVCEQNCVLWRQWWQCPWVLRPSWVCHCGSSSCARHLNENSNSFLWTWRRRRFAPLTSWGCRYGAQVPFDHCAAPASGRLGFLARNFLGSGMRRSRWSHIFFT